MKGKIRSGVVCLLLGFVAFFVFRLVYGYVASPGPSSENGQSERGFTDTSENLQRKNYASEKLKVGSVEREYSVDQKYEKVGSVSSRTDAFDDDERTARELISKHNAIVQFERNTGLKGRRMLALSIGVPPEEFDGLIDEIQAIGRLSSIRLDKTDKTNEYKNLNANRVSLEKIRDSLVSLKGKTGNIDEYINLENRILEIEREIQSTGVKLGEFDQENEFCTVKFGLEEGVTAAIAGVPFIHRVKIAGEWAIKYYLRLVAILALAALLAFLTLTLSERTVWVRAAMANYVEKTP
jgi:hypothetical protein